MKISTHSKYEMDLFWFYVLYTGAVDNAIWRIRQFYQLPYTRQIWIMQSDTLQTLSISGEVEITDLVLLCKFNYQRVQDISSFKSYRGNLIERKFVAECSKQILKT